MNRLTKLSQRRPWPVVVGWLAVLALSAPLAVGLTGELRAGGFTNPRGESAIARKVIERAFRADPSSLIVVLHSESAVRQHVGAARDAAGTLPKVTAVRDYRQNPAWMTRDGRTTLIQIGMAADDTEAQNVVPDLREALRRALPGDAVEAQVTGAPALDQALNVNSKHDVERAEMFAFPLLVIVLLLVFRSVAAMLVAVGMAGVVIVTTSAIGYMVARSTDVSILFSNAVSMIGLAVAVDYSLFVIARFREELASGADVDLALDRSMKTAGHSVVFSGFAVIIALATLFIPRIMVFSSIGLGGALVTLVALVASVSLLPAVLRLLGPRIGWGAFGAKRAPRRLSGSRSVSLARLHRRPLALLVIAAAFFFVLTAPLAGVRLQVPVASTTILPADDEARAGMDRVKAELGLRDLLPAEVVLSAPASRDPSVLANAARRVVTAVERHPEVAGARAVTTLGVPSSRLHQALRGNTALLPPEARIAVSALWARDGSAVVTRVIITPRGDPDSAGSHRLVTDIRDQASRAIGDTGVTVRVTGASAQGLDFDDAVVSSVPVIVAIVLAMTFLLLAWAFRSWILPLIALGFNALVVSAAMGVLVLLFQQGDDDALNSVTPILLFAITFGLSMDYMVIMMSRIRELHLGGVPHATAVLEGVGRTAGMVNGAAVIMIAVFASFATAEISIVQQLGIGLAVAVALDAVVIRLIVMPATLLLLGPRIWRRRERRRHIVPAASASA